MRRACLLFLFVLIFLTQPVEPAKGQGDTTHNRNQNQGQPAPTESPVNQLGVENVSSPVQQPKGESEQTKPVTRAEKIQIGINVFIALVIVWQGWIYNQQRKALNRQVWESYMSERAYMALAKLDAPVLHAETRTPFTLDFTNGGRTPAWDFAALVRSNVGDAPDMNSFWNDNHIQSTSFVSAGASRAGMQDDIASFTEQEIRDVESRKRKLFVVVECRYFDYRNKPRRHQFIGRYQPSKQQFLWHKQPEREEDKPD